MKWTDYVYTQTVFYITSTTLREYFTSCSVLSANPTPPTTGAAHDSKLGGKSLERPRPTDPRNRNTEYNPHLVVTGPEIAHI